MAEVAPTRFMHRSTSAASSYVESAVRGTYHRPLLFRAIQIVEDQIGFTLSVELSTGLGVDQDQRRISHLLQTDGLQETRTASAPGQHHHDIRAFGRVDHQVGTRAGKKEQRRANQQQD